ncbi:hypothetical protein CSB37_01135 [bacterium DOLZORAL124_38_8]|nr:MAG: hypothetical protein CSB37_01135 [bacterium DOLZORAL124_38_8]
MKEFITLYGWNLLGLFSTTFFLSVGYFIWNRKKEVSLAIVPLALLLFLLVSLASFEQNISVGLGIFGVLSFIRLRSSIDSLTDTVMLLMAVVIGILAAQVPNPVWLLLSYGVILFVFLGIILLDTYGFVAEQRTMKITFDELIILKNKKEKEDFAKRLQKEFGVRVLHFEVLTVDYLRDATKIAVTYLDR